MRSVSFDESLFTRYGGRGPRYTSYPTALQFDESFNESTYQHIAQQSNISGRPLSLYVHIPFCKSLCYYCGCNKIVTRNERRVERYVDCLHEEIRMQSTLFDRERKVTQLHFGGGTPTYLDDHQITRLMQALSNAFPFEDSDAREFSIEIDPRSTHDESMEILAQLGFNRVSLGVQDFNTDVQIAVNRIQSANDVARLMEDARRFGYRSMSFDLIYGLPYQSVSSFDSTLDQVIAMRPDRLAVYNYAHLPERFKGQRMIRDEHLPSASTKIEILRHSIEKLIDAGYVYIGMDHFALPDDDLALARENGTLQRNFQGYSTHGGSDLVSLGVSAISHIGSSFAQNALTTADYEERINAGHLPVRKGMVVDQDDLLRADVIHEIMCHDSLDFDTFSASHGIAFTDYFSNELERLEPLADDGLIQLDDESIDITDKGRLLLRSVAMVFDRHLNQDTSRFSKAI
ncbi:MAG: oxygen-independent coproporphyrinogen III oxidase [Woeseiaceae bacterium]|nr:oxygen-independent coproporphyrinogen III oxidase [Woeseiaceae bacterium]